jgi:hypothetical protein
MALRAGPGVLVKKNSLVSPGNQTQGGQVIYRVYTRHDNIFLANSLLCFLLLRLSHNKLIIYYTVVVINLHFVCS